MKRQMEQKNTGQTPRFLCLSLLVLLASCVLHSSSSFAKPERMPIKMEEQKVREHLAKQNLRNIDLNRIQDPEARKAIREVMRYLKLEEKK